MGDSRKTEDLEMKRLLQQLARTQAKISKREKIVTDKKRKADTRRKIILGAILETAVQEGAISENAVRGLLSKFASAKDKAVFENYDFITGEVATPPEPEAVPATAETAAAVHAPEASGDSARE